MNMRWLTWLLLWLPMSSLLAAELRLQLTDTNGAPIPEVAVALVPASGVERPPAQTAIIDQVNKEFVPYLSVVQAGALVRFPNSDNIRHHVYSFSEANKFELKLYSGEPSHPVPFAREGIVVLGCNIHDRMIAYVLVVDSPYFTVLQNQTEARLQAPAGAYQLLIWHPGMNAPMQESVQLSDTPKVLSRQISGTP